jgi:hypothetical protein
MRYSRHILRRSSTDPSTVGIQAMNEAGVIYFTDPVTGYLSGRFY